MPQWIQLSCVLVWTGCRFMGMCGYLMGCIPQDSVNCDAPVDRVVVCAGLDWVQIYGRVCEYFCVLYKIV